jgi:hypothetical protein
MPMMDLTSRDYYTIGSLVWYWFRQRQRRTNTVEWGFSIQIQRRLQMERGVSLLLYKLENQT